MVIVQNWLKAKQKKKTFLHDMKYSFGKDIKY
jgi:hypothetical protein